MKITSVGAVEVQGHGWNCFVRVYSDEGLFGTGECVHGGPGIRQVVSELGEALVGENPLDVERLVEGLRRRRIFDGAQAGHLITALVGIEIALWDLAGRALELPVYRLLGSRYRDRIRLYADCGREETHEAQGVKAKEIVAQGYTALKIDVDAVRHPHKLDPWNWSTSPAELDEMVSRVAAVREAVGPNVDLAVDMHGRYNAHSAIEFCRAVEPYRLLWVEDPVPPENVEAFREVKRSAPVTLCTGENLYWRHGFQQLLETQAAGVIMPDVPKCCGLAEGRFIAGMAQMHYVPMAPHNVSGPIGTVASAHLCAAIPNFLVLEFHWLDRPHWNELVPQHLIEDGHLILPDGPGLGVELDDAAAQRYLRPGTPWFNEQVA